MSWICILLLYPYSIDSNCFLVSESAGTDLRFQLLRPMVLIQQQRERGIPAPFDTVRIVEQTPADPADGMRTWTLELDRRARGELVLLVDVRTPRAAADSYAPHQLNVLNADRQNGHVAVEAGSEQHVQIVATGDDGQSLQTVDPVDFPAAYYRPVERVVEVVVPVETHDAEGVSIDPADGLHQFDVLDVSVVGVGPAPDDHDVVLGPCAASAPKRLPRAICWTA